MDDHHGNKLIETQGVNVKGKRKSVQEEKILTLHPAGKNGVQISLKKYELIKSSIINTIKYHQEISFEVLTDQAIATLQHNFDGKVIWYIVTVKLDLEARKIIEKVARSSPQKLRMKDDDKRISIITP